MENGPEQDITLSDMLSYARGYMTDERFQQIWDAASAEEKEKIIYLSENAGNIAVSESERVR